MKNLKKMLVLCSLALVFTAVLADASYAESVMETGMKKALVLFQHIKTIIFVVGAFGLIGIAFQAIFGKVKWTWFAGLAVGLVAGLIAKMGSTFANPAGGDVNAGFLGALFAGFAGGYIVLGLKKLFSKLPKSLEGIKPVLLYPVIGIFLAAVVTTFINPYMGMINDGLTHFLNGMGGTSRVVLGMILGGMMSIDMGGPFNKAAYVFGTAQLAEGNFEVMAGGMVPPIAIALCTTFFKKKFTEKERQSGVVNYVMGLSFITEGAIPFAAQDPLRVIPSCLIGSAIAGGLSMAFGCTLRAPHGGLFVLPTIGNPVMYLAAVVIGSVVVCVILGILKKNVEE